MNVDLSTDAPPSPGRTLQLAETFAEIARVLNHATMHHEALRYPSDADRLIREIASAASRLPQLISQVTRWLDAEDAAARIGMARGSRYPSSSLAADITRMHLDSARSAAARLQESLDAAASVTSDMEGGGDG